MELLGSWMVPSISIMICSVIILIIVYSYLYCVEKRAFSGIWIVSWSVYLPAQIITLILASGVKDMILASFSYILFLLSAMLLVWGTYSFLKRKVPTWFNIGILLSIVWVIFMTILDMPFIIAMIPVTVSLGISTVWIGVLFIAYGEGQKKLRIALGTCFILWGLHKMDYVFLRNIEWIAPWGYVLSAGFSLLITIIFIFIYFEKIRSEMINAQNSLISNEKRLFSIIENQRDIIFELDKNGVITFVSPACLEVTGYNKESLMGKNVSEFVGSDMWDEIKSGKDSASTFERSFLRKDKETSHVTIYCKSNFNAEGEFDGVFGSIHDITKSKMLDEAREYDKLRTEFFANISHELRTPLNVMNASTQLLDFYNKNDTQAKFGDKINKTVGTLRQNIFRLLRLINNLIDISKVDSGFVELQVNNYNIVDIVEDITLSVVDYVENKGISIEFDTEVEEKIIACDRDKIERVMLNLLSNAAKFTNKGGLIKVDIFDSENNIKICVKDTGIGIPKDKQDLIFERFRQVDMSLSRENEGSGIGLSLVKSLVELHGGYIEVQSEIGLGSEFVITLPAKQVESDTVSENFESYGTRKTDIEFSDISS